MPGARGERTLSLDLIRGIAVLGILAVNIAGFAGPSAAVLSPHLPLPAGPADEASFAAVFVLFEGKMRALFTLLLGAGIVLFVDRQEAAGRDGQALQLGRLLWLMLFGLAHYFLFWWGDILFLYAVAGLIALALRDIGQRALVVGAITLFAAWHAAGALATLDGVIAEERVRTGLASAAQAHDQSRVIAGYLQQAHEELARMRLGFLEQVWRRLRDDPFHPLASVFSTIGETLPLVMLGMALQRGGFFDRPPPPRIMAIVLAGGAAGLLVTAAMCGWLWERHFPLRAMNAALLYWTAVPHVLMALAYASLLVRWAPRIARTRLGMWLVAAGRMAFSNYIATTVVMTALFYGWGLDLAGRFGHAVLLVFVLGGWTAMLAWSPLWLARYRRGPLEWAWRSLTECRVLTFRR